MLGRSLQGLERAAANGRWNVRRHPPLSVAVTLGGLSPRSAICVELIGDLPQAQAQAASVLLDWVNRKYGNNPLYLGAMANGVRHNAAPMRIPFQHVPKPMLEQETDLYGVEQAPTPAADLLQVRMNQFKVWAEKTHRERVVKHQPSDASGW